VESSPLICQADQTTGDEVILRHDLGLGIKRGLEYCLSGRPLEYHKGSLERLNYQV
jgi:hypothetical protein